MNINLPTELTQIKRSNLEILQINVGKLCNQTCRHCHVEAGPHRKEIMQHSTIDKLIEAARIPTIHTIDITGGAPEMNPHFKYLIESLAKLKRKIIVRCNLTIIFEDGYDWLPQFYAQHQLHVVCSLPCYEENNVDFQRGSNVYEKSILALRKLNALGYGSDEQLQLDLVYNPVGGTLPPDQQALEADYKKALYDRFGIRFNTLIAIANVPIGRFKSDLIRQNQYEDYLSLLHSAYNVATLPHLMCRNTLSVGWDGQLYDCDFNQMLDLKIASATLDDLLTQGQLPTKDIMIGKHCLACTAGAGSSCQGSLA